MPMKKYIFFFFIVVLAINLQGEIKTQEKVTIEPLLTTKWGQGEPYNIKFIEYIGSTDIGCTPTALSQIMKYYNYPANGMRDNSYKHNDVVVEYKLTNVHFEWDKMFDTYISDVHSLEQCNAISELMFAVSTTLPMAHATHPFGDDPLPFCESASLEYFFGYDSGMRHLEHKYFDDETWENIVYYELSKGRPVFFNGYGPGTGHAFVCDGYKDGLYHFNWGWGGGSNDFYSLAGLLYNGGQEHMEYIYNQNITIGITPKGKNNDPNPYLPSNCFLVIDSDFGKHFEYRVMKLTPFRCEVGIKLTNSQGDIKYVKTNDLIVSSRHQQTCELNLPTILNDISDGDYTVTPVYRESGNTSWEDMLIPLDKVHYMSLYIRNHRCTFLDGKESRCYADVYVTDFKPVDGTVESNNENAFYFTTVNRGTIPFYGGAQINILDRSGKKEATTYTMLCANNYIDSDTYVNDVLINVPDGKYTVQFVDELNGKPLSSTFNLVVGKDNDLSVKDSAVDNNKSILYYNLNGYKIEEKLLSPGIYIKQTGQKFEKVLIK